MNLRVFSLQILKHCPLFTHAGPDVHHRAYEHWIGYKKRIPVRGAILLNEALDSVVLVKPWGKGSSWMFPRGKVNQNEDDLDCAVREVWEETGFHAQEAGLVPANRVVASHELTMREQHIKLFFIPNVPMDTRFETRTRKEISKIQWYRIADLPGRSKKKTQAQAQAQAQETNGNKFFMVAPFMDPLNRWIKQQLKRRDRGRNSHRNGLVSQAEIDEVMTEEEGATTEVAPEARVVFESVESREARSRELHRLLHIQPAPERSQINPTGATAAQDKGKALLAMLQQKKDVPLPSAPPTGLAGAPVSLTSVNRDFNGPPLPHNPHYHHLSHVAPPGVYEAPPSHPVQADINSQMRSFLGIGSNSTGQTLPQQPQMRTNQQHLLTPSISASQAFQPHLAHPQPLPPQANHILAGGPAPTPQNGGSRNLQPQQLANMALPSASSMGLPQQLVANLGQRPTVLDNNRLALLNAFKNGPSPPKEPATAVASPQPPVYDRRSSQPQQSLAQAVLGSPYNSQRTVLPVQQGLQSPMASVAAKPHISPMQQRALLDIFKQPSGASPRIANARPDLKENSMPPMSGQRILDARNPMAFSAGTEQQSVLHQMEMPSVRASSSQNVPHGAQPITMPPNNEERKGPVLSNSGAQIMNALMMNSSVTQTASTPGNPASIPQTPHIGGSSYSNLTHAHVPTPAATSNVLPNVVPRRQEADPQQVQKLMSLFNQTTISASSNSIANTSVAPASREPSGAIPPPASRASALRATPGLDGAMSMPGGSSQQAPISPENEKFLLNYLKAVSDSAK